MWLKIQSNRLHPETSALHFVFFTQTLPVKMQSLPDIFIPEYSFHSGILYTFARLKIRLVASLLIIQNN